MFVTPSYLAELNIFTKSEFILLDEEMLSLKKLLKIYADKWNQNSTVWSKEKEGRQKLKLKKEKF